MLQTTAFQPALPRRRALRVAACSLVVAAAAWLGVVASPASAASQVGPTPDVHNFGPNLLGVCPNPEGLTVDLAGNLYTSSLNFVGDTATGNGGANICKLDRGGNVVETIKVPPGPNSNNTTTLIGGLFEPFQGLYVMDFANDITAAGGPSGQTNGRLLKVDPQTKQITTLATGFAGPNAVAQDRFRNLYVSDSFAGTITKVAPNGKVSLWKSDPLLTPGSAANNEPPFGANGVEFDLAQQYLYVANTHRNQIERIKVNPDGSAGAVTTFADGNAIDAATGTPDALVGADGIAFDFAGNLWVDANSANEIQQLSPNGKSLLSRHVGTNEDNALDFNASPVFYGTKLFTSNVSLTTGGVNSKLSQLDTDFLGVPFFAPF